MASTDIGKHGNAPGIEVKNVGIKWSHPAGFVVDRPKGSGDYAFMQWLTQTTIRLDGTVREERPGGCIIFRPHDPQWFGGGVFTPFVNNWFHFFGPDVGYLLDESRLPLNRALYLSDESFVEPLLHTILRESMLQPFLWQRLIAASVERFFVEMSRSLRGVSARLKSARSAELRDVFEDLRYELKQHCAEAWTLKSMAEKVHLSASRFSQLYKQYFDINPVDDLIRMRIAMAEYYLCTTTMPIGNIAGLCGFADSQYFSRQFKNKTGDSPARYRLLHGGANEESWGASIHSQE